MFTDIKSAYLSKMRLPIIFSILFCLGGCGNGNEGAGSIDGSQTRMDSLQNAAMEDSIQRQLNVGEGDAAQPLFDSATHAQLIRNVLTYDTITANGNFVKHFVDSAENIFIIWGSKTTGVIDTIVDESGGWGKNCASYGGENDQYLALMKYGKGLMHVYLLPLHKRDTVMYFYTVVAFDMKQNLMFMDEDGNEKFTLENFVSHKKTTFLLTSVPRITYSIPIFDSIGFRKDAVYLEWQGEDEKKHSQLQKL